MNQSLEVFLQHFYRFKVWALKGPLQNVDLLFQKLDLIFVLSRPAASPAYWASAGGQPSLGYFVNLWINLPPDFHKKSRPGGSEAPPTYDAPFHHASPLWWWVWHAPCMALITPDCYFISSKYLFNSYMQKGVVYWVFFFLPPWCGLHGHPAVTWFFLYIINGPMLCFWSLGRLSPSRESSCRADVSPFIDILCVDWCIHKQRCLCVPLSGLCR